MPYIKVNISQLQNSRDVVSAVRNRASNIKSSFYSIGSSLDWDVKSCSGINRTINQINNELANEVASMKRMTNFFDTAIRKYKEVDEPQLKIIKKQFGVTTLGPGGRFKRVENNIALLSLTKANKISLAKQTTVDDSGKSEVAKLALKILKKAGFVGSVYSIISGEAETIEQIKKGEYGEAIKTYAGVVKGVCKTVPSIIKKYNNLQKAKHLLTPAQKLKNWSKSLLGLDDFVKAPSTATKLSTRWYNNYKKIEVKQLGKIGVADVLVNGLVNIIDNVADYRQGKMDATRTALEIASETAIDIAKDAVLYTVIGTAATTAVGAIAAAVGVTAPISVPVIAVAGLVVLANYGLDKLAKHITNGEKDFTEMVSDGLIAAGEWIGNTAVKAYNAVAPKVKNVVNNIKSTASNVLGNVRNGVNNFFGKLKFAF